jgi:HJR/Mrr/RecB family endonuclease
VAAFLVGAALWLLRPLFRWVLDLASSGVVAAASPPPARRQAETPRKSKTSASGRVFGLSPREFEVLCADICRRWGYNTRLGRGTADGGVDIELWRGDVYGIAQCKLYQGTVPIAMVRDFYGTMMHRGAKIGFIFTTGRFPVSAEEFVRGKEIRLVDGVYLRAILLEQRQRDWLTKLSSRIVRS